MTTNEEWSAHRFIAREKFSAAFRALVAGAIKQGLRRDECAEIATAVAGMSKLVPLSECPIGLFVSGSELCLKTEYGDNEGRIDAYIVSTGEFFWGGAKTKADQRRVLVTPVAPGAGVLERIAAANSSDPASDDLTVALAIDLADARSRVGQLLRALESIARWRPEQRPHVDSSNAFEEFSKANATLCAVFTIADVALAKAKGAA